MSQGKNSAGGHRPHRSNNHHRHKPKVNPDDNRKEGLDRVDENSAVIKQFRGYAAELDRKHDRYERLVKLCREITIESKRIIFLLHTLDDESKRDAILGEAKTRLDNVAKTLFKSAALELEGQDPYQFNRSYRIGLQEFVEAVTFYQYLKDDRIEDWTYLEKLLTYEIPIDEREKNHEIVNETKLVATLVVPNEYVLGIADLTGELMRKCISNLASGDVASCYRTCNFVRDMYKGFLGCAGVSAKEIHKKMYTLRQSLMKIENVCYTIKVRGSEIPKHMLADVAIVAADDYPGDDDEGYQVY